MSEIVSAIAFHPAEYFLDELDARKMSIEEVAMGDPVDTLALYMFAMCADRSFKLRNRFRMGAIAEVVARAFDMSVECWNNLERSYLESVAKYGDRE